MPDRTYSLIIPIYALDKDRERAFRFVLSKALAYSVFSEVIIVEQLNDGQTPLDLPEGVTRVNYRTDLEESHKSKLVNLGAMQATGDVLFVNDCDIWLDWRTATKELNKLEMFAYCKPFSHFVRLDQQDADRLIETNLAANRGTTITVPIAGSFAIMRSLFLLIGGMDERFTGWAQEDTELRARLGKWFPITVLDRLVGRHLYHDRDSTTIRAHARQYSHIFAQSATGTFLGNLRKVETSIPKPAQRPLDDTAYVVCHYGTANELRNTATRESLEWLTYSQDELPRLIFAELTCGTEPQYADFADNPHIDYIHIQGDDSNSDLMQKEAIYNHVLANHSKGEKVWIFGDSDILPIDSDWIAETRRKVLENPRAIVHGYSVWRDQEQERLQISIARFKTDKPRDYPAPGLVWATHADYIEEFTEGGRPSLTLICLQVLEMLCLSLSMAEWRTTGTTTIDTYPTDGYRGL